jgi:chromosomal replication initiation ATPase DnaA
MASPIQSEQLLFAFEPKRSTAREDFMTGASNASALDFIDAWPAWPGRVCAIWGPSGSGKTHLAQIWKRAAGAIELAPDEVTVERLADLEPGSAVLVDGAGQSASGSGLFHLINFTNQTQGWLLLTGEQAPQRWPTTVPDLHSRLTAIGGVGLDLPDEALMARVLIKLSHDRQLKFPEALIAYLAPRLRRSFVDAERLVAMMDYLALEKKRRLSVEIAASALQRLYGDEDVRSADNPDALG